MRIMPSRNHFKIISAKKNTHNSKKKSSVQTTAQDAAQQERPLIIKSISVHLEHVAALLLEFLHRGDVYYAPRRFHGAHALGERVSHIWDGPRRAT